MNSVPAAKIKMIRASIRCLVYGLLSFLPGIGFPFAIVALWVGGSVRKQEKQLWNAARPYRLIGVTCAAVSCILWLLMGSVIAYNIVTQVNN